MLRHAVPLLVLLACAGCGAGTRSQAKPMEKSTPAPVAHVEPAPVPAVVVAPVKKLKKGQIAPVTIAQPAASELPADFGLDTTPEQLANHALITAREQVESGLSGGASLPQRRDFLIAAWTPLLRERQQREAAIRAERERVAKQQIEHAVHLSAREEKLQAMEADYDHRLAVERLRTAPIESH